jgi:hypothetical protein
MNERGNPPGSIASDRLKAINDVSSFLNQLRRFVVDRDAFPVSLDHSLIIKKIAKDREPGGTRHDKSSIILVAQFAPH